MGTILIMWLAASIPLALLVGRFLRVCGQADPIAVPPTASRPDSPPSFVRAAPIHEYRPLTPFDSGHSAAAAMLAHRKDQAAEGTTGSIVTLRMGQNAETFEHTPGGLANRDTLPGALRDPFIHASGVDNV